MAGLKRGVSVSQFLANGNTISPLTTNYPPSDDLDLSFEDDLSKFTNLEWSEFDGSGGAFDAEEGGATDAGHNKRLKVQAAGGENAGAESTATTITGEGETDWTTAEQYNPFDIPLDGGAASSVTEYDATLLQQTGPTTTTTTAYPSAYPTTAAPLAHQTYPPNPQTYPSTASATSPAQSLEDNPAARAATEEDKRRRNTAASARFRVKKKQREQALEKTADELKTKAAELEQQVGQLKRENDWLRGLVVLKSGEPSKNEEEDERKKEDVKAEEAGTQSVDSKADKLKKGYGTKS